MDASHGGGRGWADGPAAAMASRAQSCDYRLSVCRSVAEDILTPWRIAAWGGPGHRGHSDELLPVLRLEFGGGEEEEAGGRRAAKDDTAAPRDGG